MEKEVAADITGSSGHVVARTLRKRVAALEAERDNLRIELNNAVAQAIRDAALKAADAAIVIDQRGLIDTVNAAASDIFQYTAEQLIGRNIAMLMPGSDARHHDRYLTDYLNGGTPKIIGVGREVEGRRANGETFPMSLTISEFSLGDISPYSPDEAAFC